MKPIDLAVVREAKRILVAMAETYPELAGPRWQRALMQEVNMADSTQIAVRMPKDLLAKVDAFAKQASQPGLELTRADAVRVLVARALEGAASGRGKRRK